MDNAELLTTELIRFIMNEKNIPKSYRFIYTIPIKNEINNMWRWINVAKGLWIEDAEFANQLILEKKHAWSEARASVEQILHLLQEAVLVLHFDVNKLDSIANRLLAERRLLAGLENKCHPIDYQKS